MVKYIAKIEIKVKEKAYQLLCDADSPIQDTKEALFQMLKEVGVIEDQANLAKQQAEAKQAEPPEETANAASQG